MRTDEQVMEQSSTPIITPTFAPTGIKTILFHVHDDDGLEGRMQAGLAIARAFGAHLHLLHVTPIEAYTVVDAFATYVNAELVEVLEEEAAKLKAKLEQQLANEDVSWDYEEVTAGLMTRLIQRAALSDLVLTGREPHEREFGGPAVTLLGDMVHRIRTPIAVISEERHSFDPFGPAMIAWNGSHEAANALRSAVPLLKLASKVRMVTVEEHKDPQFPSTSALEYLSRHGIHAELCEREQLADSVEEELLDEVELDGSGYIVMGAYSHTRAGEFLFGGVTRSLLKKCPYSLVMAH
jgi:nucleotide-binding universal stress UspA family protein